ncbi:hypothetical protein ACFOMD_06935 [Sphingoaurantiacus capsulatus]|uniref:Uncharacterized protein n=1 Tax=Sphingoaurantiacus capsulatus TaxID=1771310 RepID=A0ABV7XAM6_9SPHN
MMDAQTFRFDDRPADLVTGLSQTPARETPPPLFELPSVIFAAMAVAYLLFIAAMLFSFGSGAGMPLLLGIVGFYLLMYLGTPAVLAHLGLHRRATPFRGIDTPGGRMSPGAVLGQVLVVPACVAGFGFAIGVIVALL